jgi:LysR family transcriptional activator of dmlA
MNDISDIEFFCIVAKHDSLAAASQALGLTPPAASKRLAALERRLGVRLLNRTTRRRSVTQEGDQYFASGKRILEEIAEVERSLAGALASPKGLLRVNATPGFGRHHIAPAISAFLKEFPDVSVQLDLTDRPSNLVEDGFDLGIRIGTLSDSRMTARKIASNRSLLCASPTYLKTFGVPVSPRDLHDHRCIFRSGKGAEHRILELRSGTRRERVKVQAAVWSNDPDVNVGWALDGHGILKHSEWEVAQNLRSGRLVRVLKEWSLPPADVYAVYPDRRNLSAKVRVFLNFLSNRFAKHVCSTNREDGNW